MAKDVKRGTGFNLIEAASVVLDIERVRGICQNCKSHTNRPSKCTFYGYVGRKELGCKDYRSK